MDGDVRLYGRREVDCAEVSECRSKRSGEASVLTGPEAPAQSLGKKSALQKLRRGRAEADRQRSTRRLGFVGEEYVCCRQEATSTQACGALCSESGPATQDTGYRRCNGEGGWGLKSFLAVLGLYNYVVSAVSPDRVAVNGVTERAQTLSDAPKGDLEPMLPQHLHLDIRGEPAYLT